MSTRLVNVCPEEEVYWIVNLTDETPILSVAVSLNVTGDPTDGFAGSTLKLVITGGSQSRISSSPTLHAEALVLYNV